MFEIDDEYIKEVNKNYWTEEDEMRCGVHPLQIMAKVQIALNDSGIKGKITSMDYISFSGERVGVYVNGNFYGVFNYDKDEFESITENKHVEFELRVKLNQKEYINKKYSKSKEVNE